MEIFLSYYETYSQTASTFPPLNKVMKINIGNLTENEINFSCFWKVPLILIFEPCISDIRKHFFVLVVVIHLIKKFVKMRKSVYIIYYCIFSKDL